MDTPAQWDGGPGLFWTAVVAGAVTPARRTGRGPRPPGDSPIAVLGRRFASGEFDEDEYGRRLPVLEERFGCRGKSGAA